MSTIRKLPNGRYEIRSDVGAGKRSQVKRRFRTRKEAQEALARLEVSVADGTFVASSKLTLDEWLDEWLGTQRSQIRPSTLESYERNLRLHVRPRLGGLRLRDLKPPTLTSLYTHLHQSGRVATNSTKAGLSARSVRYIGTILGKALRDAVSQQVIAINPATGAKTPKRDEESRQKEMRTWTGQELRRFLDSVAGEALLPVFFVLGTTGMRRGETLGLRWSDVDLNQGRASIQQTVIAVGHQVMFSEPKTDRGRRTVPLPAEAVAVLRSHRKVQAEQKLVTTGYRDRDLVFADPNGDPLDPESVTAVFDRRVAKARLPRIRLHDLRHTYATLGLDAGVALKVISEILGHSSIAITGDLYSHVTPGMQEEAADIVAAKVFGGAE